MGLRLRKSVSWLQKISVLAVIALISACTTVPTPQVDNAVVEFSRSGRFAINVQHRDDKRDAAQGGFSWLEQRQQIRLDLTNPMGSVLARIVVEAGGAATLYRTDGSTEHASSPDALVAQVLGSAIPVSKLRDWIRGTTSNTAHNLALENAKPVSFYDDGWRVRLQRYDEQGPRLLLLNRNDSQGDISVRLVIDN